MKASNTVMMVLTIEMYRLFWSEIEVAGVEK
jgi:hypothetical protein